MTSFRRLLAAALALLCILTGCTAAQPVCSDIYECDIFSNLPDTVSDASPMLWVMTDGQGDKIYLLGSIHAAESSLYRLPDVYMDTFASCDALAVECDIIEYQKTSGELSELLKGINLKSIRSLFENGGKFAELLSSSYDFMYTDGTDAYDHLGQGLCEKLLAVLEPHSEFVERHGYTLDTLPRYKPAVWASLFSSLVSELAGLDSSLGVDTHFLSIAKQTGKTVLELESVNGQFEMMNSISDQAYAFVLSTYAQTPLEQCAAGLRGSYGLWRQGDLANFTLYASSVNINSLTQSEAKLMVEYDTVMLYDRNKKMADKITGYADEDGLSVFVVAGAAHMVGAGGIIDLLISRGYEVSLVDTSAA